MNRNVCIHTDSRYSIDCVTKWFPGWIKKGWKNAQGKDIENKDIIKDIIQIVDDRHMCRSKTDFEWVKGHAGDVQNEEADRLAVAGALENQKRHIHHPATLVDANSKVMVYDESGEMIE
jgi:ribonuclease HI